MPAIDLILNLAGLLLWLNWRSAHFDPLLKRTPATLVGTLRPAQSRGGKRWVLLAGLAALVAVRSVVYWELGSAVDWTPKLNLGLVVLAFRGDSYPAAISFAGTLLFSMLSLMRLLMIFYFWLFALALINRRDTEAEPLQKLIRMHLGLMANWPWAAQLLTPLAASATLWLALNPVLVSVGVLDRAHSLAHLAGQAALVSAGLVLSLNYLLCSLLLLHVVLTYVYLGSSPLWDFVSHTARHLSAPFRSLQFARIDLAPLAAALLVATALHWIPNLLVRELLKRNLTLWPQ